MTTEPWLSANPPSPSRFKRLALGLATLTTPPVAEDAHLFRRVAKHTALSRELVVNCDLGEQGQEESIVSGMLSDQFEDGGIAARAKGVCDGGQPSRVPVASLVMQYFKRAANIPRILDAVMASIGTHVIEVRAAESRIAYRCRGCETHGLGLQRRTTRGVCYQG